MIACTGLPGLDDDPDGFATHTRALIKTNGIGANGIGANGIGANGIGANGIGANGLLLNGIGANGIGANGIGANGLLLNGIGANGVSPSNVPIHTSALNSLYVNGIGVNGVGIDGIGTNMIASALGQNGLVIAGIGVRTAGPDTIGSNGTGTSNMDMRGMSINGFFIHQAGMNSLLVNDAGLRETGLHGLVINGAGSGHIRVLGAGVDDLELMDLDSAQESVLGVALYHLVGCALAQGTSATITSSDGTPTTYQGLRGFAPEWRDGALSQQGEERVRACLESAPGAVIGLGLNAEQELNLEKVLTYMVECALPENEDVTIYTSSGAAKVYQGALGLAPEWRDSALTLQGQKAVSACLAARTNALERTVTLSMRGAGLTTTQVERDLYATYEGAFWGNFFATEPAIYTCVAQGGGLSGRVCAEGNCGFTSMGDCASVCGARDAVEGNHTSCNGETIVISTFLSLGSRVQAGEVSNNCIIATNGTLWCVGDNTHGQIGDGTTIDRSEPTLVSALGNQGAEASLGKNHACERKRDGSLWCWGDNQNGQLGDGTLAAQHTPVHVAGLGFDVATIHTGRFHTCAVKTNGSAWCWGDNSRGQVGSGTSAAHLAQPAQVTNLSANVARLTTAIKSHHVCAVKNNGTLWCWGANDQGQLGDGTTQDRPQPVQVANDEHGISFAEVTDACSTEHTTCARKANGTVWCWGSNYAAKPKALDMPVNVAPGGLACGTDHLCVVTDESTVWCAGQNTYGQLGRDTGGAPSYTMEPVPGVQAVSFATAGQEYTCAMRVDGTMACWGTNPGVFPTTLSLVPTEIEWSLCGDGICTADESATCSSDC